MNSPAELGTVDVRITLDDIFQTVCDLPPDKRSAYLNEACAGDEAMRREVEDLIRYYETNKTFLEKPAIQDVAQQMVESGEMATPTPEPLIGKVIGNYRILSTIFAGGMGEVYLARDLSLDVDVAVKFLRREFNDDPEWQARLEREARLQAGLNHPNIVGIHYKGEFDGRPFLVFEFVPGETLKDRLDKGPLPIKEALPLFSQLADALKEAHDNGIIHRDLKPSNLMVTPTGQLKVLDFGIAKKISADLTTVDLGIEAGELTRDYGKTRKGEVMGTVAYMSPEQTRGEPLDVRTDVWA
ncbi:MAG: serine/threonine-protein kinase, partial [Blastocatellia bacterium]